MVMDFGVVWFDDADSMVSTISYLEWASMTTIHLSGGMVKPDLE